MCGIVGYVGKNNKTLQVLIEGLESLEYRGYDSAGVTFIKDNKLNVIKEQGRISNLKEKIDFNTLTNIGLGHTRWATHGIPSQINAHPHNVDKIAIVHNGIIENYVELRKKLDYNFKSQTDTEVACCLLNELIKKHNNTLDAIKEFEKQVKGAYAIGLLNENEPDTIYAIKKNSPLIIGVGDNESFIASDIYAILKFTNRYIILEDSCYAKITTNSIDVYDKDGNKLENDIKIFDGTAEAISKGLFDHFMLKEINEEPEVIKNTIDAYLNDGKIDFSSYIKDINKYNKICIIACGSAVHAGLVGKYLIEEYANIPVDVEIASEFRYKKIFIDSNTLVIPISQSGETADTLEALKLAKEHNCDSLGIINVYRSSIARICDEVLYIKAGPEIAVATTKAYLAQVLILSMLAIYFGSKKCLIDKKIEKIIYEELKALPTKINSLLENNKYKEIANKLYNHDNIFFIGRNIDYALCKEGSLKLKEISYIHSEAYQAGELKHGTISLIDNNTPVIGIVTKKDIADKTISNIKEVYSRGGIITLIVNETLDIDDDFYQDKIVIPNSIYLFNSILTIIPLQIISYEVAKLRGCDIDKPKNLAKSVTVE